MSPLLNYTTKIEAIKTAGEIQRILAQHGAKAVLTEYDDGGNVEALSFKVNTPHGEVGIRLPVNPDAVLKVISRERVPARYANKQQAVRISWRILKNWVEAQLALLSTEMVSMEQLFLPYAITQNGTTLYEALIEDKFKMLTRGKKS